MRSALPTERAIVSLVLMPPDANIFASRATALVNPVDCTGAQGKGLALEFRRRWPHAASVYKTECARGEVSVGRVLMFPLNNGKTVVFFPTKRHWREKSGMSIVAGGLMDLDHRLSQSRIHSVAIPALGCGLGGLDWLDVLPLLNTFAERPSMRNVSVEVYPPR